MLLKLCFKCYQVGHNKRSCWIKDPVCVYCPESHLHEDCPKRKGLERPPPRCPFCKGNPPHGPWEDACEHPPIKEARDRMLKAIKAGAPWDPSRHQPDDEPLHELLEKLMETVHEGRRYNTTRNIGVKNAPKRNPTSRPAGSTRTPAATDNKQPTATSPDSDSHNWEDMSEGGELPEETQESAMQLSEMPVPSLVDIASFETYPSFTKRRRDSSQSSYQPSTRGSSPDELSAPPRHSSTSALALVPSAQDVAASGRRDRHGQLQRHVVGSQRLKVVRRPSSRLRSEGDLVDHRRLKARRRLRSRLRRSLAFLRHNMILNHSSREQ